MADEMLTKDEWEAAMRTILAAKDAPKGDDKDDADAKGAKKGGGKLPPEFFSKKFKKPSKDALTTEIPAGGGFVPRVGKPDYTSNKVSHEIPNNHPPKAGAPRLANDKPVDDEIPAGGGFASKTGKPDYTSNKVSKEIPNAHPAGTGSPRTPDMWDSAGINYGSDTTVGWSTGKPLPTPGSTVWGESPIKNNRLGYGDTPPDGKTVSDTENKAPRTSMANEEADSNLSHGPEAQGDHLALPDGSFMIAQPGDLHAAIAKVQNADKTNPRIGHPNYMEVKRHIARRAASMGMGHMVPADWQLSMAMKAEEEIARTFSTEQRESLAKTGKAMPGGGYPIENMNDLHNAIQAFGRSNPGERGAVKAHIAKRAKALGAPAELISHISSLGNSGN